jgi:hypothetical protein
MFDAFESACFQWLGARENICVYSEDWIRPYSQEQIAAGMGKVAFEHIWFVLNDSAGRFPGPRGALIAG